MKKFIFTALLSLSLTAQEQNIFYKDADIKTFAQDIALLTDKTIILDPRVNFLAVSTDPISCIGSKVSSVVLTGLGS